MDYCGRLLRNMGRRGVCGGLANLIAKVIGSTRLAALGSNAAMYPVRVDTEGQMHTCTRSNNL